MSAASSAILSVAAGRTPGFGELAPLFTAATDNVARYNFGVAGGRWIVLMFFGTLATEASRQAHAAGRARAALFDDARAAFFGVSVDVNDRTTRGLANAASGVRYFWDFDLAVSRLYGLTDGSQFQPAIFLIDPALRIVQAEPIAHTDAVLDALERHLGQASEDAHAPVLSLPRLFEPDFCRSLIAHFQAMGGKPSGFAAELDGRTRDLVDPRLKRREDVFIEDEALIARLRSCLESRLHPMVKRAFGWDAVHIERYLVSRYSAENSGFFSAHRDDATAGTAHRKFAVTVNLNAEDYEGGELRFPEFGRRLFRPPTGGAVVFGCNLLHEVTPVTQGVRYAFIPFLYDEEGARLRRKNLSLVGAVEGNRQARRAARRR
jgi:predicted 2-oxoglutarate/Fe(II)-dependent dioxygenase YbiX/peroxiredoxin